MMLVPGLLFLFYPLDTWLGGRVRLRDYEQMRAGAGAWWRQSWIWADPLRAFAGGWLLKNSWAIEPPLPGIWRHVPLMSAVAVMALAVVAQMHTRRADGVLYAPIGYVAGLLFAVLPPEVAVLVVALAGACLMAFRGWAAYFLCGALGAGVFGYLILRGDFWMAAAVILMLEPLLLSLLVQRQLMFPVLAQPGRRAS